MFGAFYFNFKKHYSKRGLAADTSFMRLPARGGGQMADPAVLFNYLSDPRDVAELVDGYRTAQE